MRRQSVNNDNQKLLQTLKAQISYQDKLDRKVFLGPVTKIIKKVWEERVRFFAKKSA